MINKTYNMEFYLWTKFLPECCSTFFGFVFFCDLCECRKFSEKYNNRFSYWNILPKTYDVSPGFSLPLYDKPLDKITIVLQSK